MSNPPDLLLLGDSHLTRIRRARLRRLEAASGHRVLNAAVGGASVLGLSGQLDGAPPADVAMLSVGTNDAAPWKQVPIDTFRTALSELLPRVPASRVVYVGSPGIDEQRLTRENDRTNLRLREYVDAAAETVRRHGGEFLDAAALLARVDDDVFLDDGVHLNKTGYDVLLPALAACALTESSAADERP
ncbi:MAG: SGNH/GDSL hydrolase family protein [Nocardioides sp.]